VCSSDLRSCICQGLPRREAPTTRSDEGRRSPSVEDGLCVLPLVPDQAKKGDRYNRSLLKESYVEIRACSAGVFIGNQGPVHQSKRQACIRRTDRGRIHLVCKLPRSILSRGHGSFRWIRRKVSRLAR